LTCPSATGYARGYLPAREIFLPSAETMQISLRKAYKNRMSSYIFTYPFLEKNPTSAGWSGVF